MSKLELATAQELRVRPHWLPGNDAFWYRKTLHSGESLLYLVDAVKGERRVVFDSSSTVRTLKSKGHSHPSTHPYAWLDTDPSLGLLVRFWLGSHCWQYLVDGEDQPQTCKGEVPFPKAETIASIRGDVSRCTVTFRNRSTQELVPICIDRRGKFQSRDVLGPGTDRQERSFFGRSWVVVTKEDNRVVAMFSASREEEQDVTIEATPSEDFSMKAIINPEPNGGSADPADSPAETGDVYSIKPWEMAPGGPEAYGEDNIFLSPDKLWAVAWQATAGQERKLVLVDNCPKDQLQPRAVEIPYDKPGDRILVHRPRLFNMQTGLEVPTADDLFHNPYRLESFEWSPDSGEYRFLYNERGHKTVRLLGMSCKGKVRTICEETSETFVDHNKFEGRLERRALPETDEVLWSSERDGYNHLYLLDLSTGTMSQITSGNWNVRTIEHLDKASRRVIIHALGIRPDEDPYYSNLVSVGLDGSGLTMLTRGEGSHSWEWSPDARYIIDTWSSVDQSPQSVLRNAKSGELVVELESKDDRELISEGWRPPERFSAAGRDGKTLVYGIIVRPTHFDESQSYPVLDYIYAGPQDFFTPKMFAQHKGLQQWADQGFIVVQVDGMGTNWRNKAFHDVCYKNLKDAGLPDHIEWLKSAAKTRPWMDLSRVGIFGASAGGQSAVSALLHHGDFYKVANANAGCHDNRIDKLWWNELWMGHPVDKSYEENSNATHVAKMSDEAALLLVVGGMDQNVDPACTLQLSCALHKAGKDHELLFVPDGDHGCGSTGYVLRRRIRFMQQHLGVEAPRPSSDGYSIEEISTDW